MMSGKNGKALAQNVVPRIAPPAMQHYSPPVIRLVQNDEFTLSRAVLARLAGGRLPDLDIDSECRYPLNPGINDYQTMYDRQGIATRVVGVFPEESWQMEPEIFESEDLDDVTDFEAAWEEMNTNLHILSHLQTADEVSGIGEFGILLLGFAGVEDPKEPVKGMRNDGTFDNRVSKARLNYVRPFSQTYVRITKIEIDQNNPRFGQPVEYSITFASPAEAALDTTSAPIAQQNVAVHWTRVLHLADNRKNSMVMGVPRLRPVFNDVFNIRKILGASGQGYWQGGFPGLSIETQVGIEAPDFDKEFTKAEVQKYMESQQRSLMLEGLTAKTLTSQIADPRPHYETHLENICISINVPMRIFKGSEEAKLASSQDTRTWTKRLKKRQDYYITPFVLREFFTRMFAVGALPKPKVLHIRWPDLNSPTEGDRATVAQKISDALLKYITSNASSLIGPKEYLIHVLGFPEPRVDAILKAVSDKIGNLDKLTKVATTPPPPAAVGQGAKKPVPKTRKPKKPSVTETA